MGITSQIDAERFWSKVNKTEGCWEWIGRVNTKGYGAFHIESGKRLLGVRNRKTVYAHRYSYLIAKGDLGKLCVCHHCDNPKCVRPDHLFLDTRAKNNEDKAQKGRAPKGSRNPTAKLTEQAVAEIRERYARNETSQQALADEFGVSQGTIRDVLSGRKWKHVLGPIISEKRVTKGVQRFGAKLTEQTVITIRDQYAKGGIGKLALAKEYGVSRIVISCALSRRTWKHVP